MYPDPGVSPAVSYDHPSAIEVLALETYISELERELERQAHRYEETIARFESLLEEQQRAYQSRIHELEGQGCYCDTDAPPAARQGRGGLVSSLIPEIVRRK